MRPQGVLIMSQTTRGRLMILFLGQLLFTASFSVDLTLTDRSFLLFCYSTVAMGMFQAFDQHYRLAATDDAPEATRARNISSVLSGGVIASLLGPGLTYMGDDIILRHPMLESVSSSPSWPCFPPFGRPAPRCKGEGCASFLLEQDESSNSTPSPWQAVPFPNNETMTSHLFVTLASFSLSSRLYTRLGRQGSINVQ